MKRTLWVAACFVASLASAVQAQEFPKPGPEHELLKKNEGTWTAVCKMPDGSESKAEAVYKMECGGLWLRGHFKGDFGGASFEGIGLDTYDPEKKKFIGIWVDSMSTSPMTMEGTYDEKTKTLTSVGEGKGPDGKLAKYKMATRYKDEDHHTLEMYLVGPDGKDNLMMTVEYTRKK
jgi:hypothetical protein